MTLYNGLFSFLLKLECALIERTDVVRSMLGDITDTQGGVLVHGTFLRLGLTLLSKLAQSLKSRYGELTVKSFTKVDLPAPSGPMIPTRLQVSSFSADHPCTRR